MKTIKRSISFVDWIPSLEKVQIHEQLGEVYYFDPHKVEGVKNWWGHFDEDLSTLNKVYGELFDEVVVKEKNLICYWPNVELSHSQQYEINKSLTSAGLEMNIFVKDTPSKVESFTYAQQEAWKEFILTLLESLCEDLQLNKGLQDVMSLKGKDTKIDILRLIEDGETKYFYVQTNLKDPKNYIQEWYADKSYPSFSLLLKDLLASFKLSNFAYVFHLPEFEKVFYKEMLEEDVYTNLVLTWTELLNKN